MESEDYLTDIPCPVCGHDYLCAIANLRQDPDDLYCAKCEKYITIKED